MRAPIYAKAEDLLIALHELIAREADESPEGEALRDQLDQCWLQLGDAERRRLDGLSANLYMLQDRD